MKKYIAALFALVALTFTAAAQTATVLTPPPWSCTYLGWTGTAWVCSPSVGSSGRELLIADRDYFVRDDGNDTACTGLVNAAYVSGSYPQACAFRYPQRADDVIQSTIDLGGKKVRVLIADSGTSYGTLNVSGKLVGQKTAADYSFIGNTASPGNVIVSGNGAAAVDANYGANFTIDGMRVDTGTGSCVRAWTGGFVQIGGNVWLGACALDHLYAAGGAINSNNGYRVIGTSARHQRVETLGTISVVGGAIDFAAGLNFSDAFMVGSYNGVMDWQPGSITGSAVTGRKYALRGGAVIIPAAGDEAQLANLPGSLPGVRADSVAFASVYNSASQSIPNDGNWHVVEHNTVEADPAGWFNTTTHRFTPKQRGWYLATASVQAAGMSDGKQFVSGIYKNGTVGQGYDDPAASATLNLVSTVTTMVYLNGSTDYIDHQAYNPDTGARSTYGSRPATRLQVFYLGDWQL